MGRTACALDRRVRRFRVDVHLRRRSAGVRRSAIQFTHRRNEDGRHSRCHSRVGLKTFGARRGVQSSAVRSATCWRTSIRTATNAAAVEGH